MRISGSLDAVSFTAAEPGDDAMASWSCTKSTERSTMLVSPLSSPLTAAATAIANNAVDAEEILICYYLLSLLADWGLVENGYGYSPCLTMFDSV